MVTEPGSLKVKNLSTQARSYVSFRMRHIAMEEERLGDNNCS